MYSEGVENSDDLCFDCLKKIILDSVINSFIFTKRDNKMKKVLVIDDEEIFCSFIKTFLESISDDYNVITATDGRQGLKAASRYRPDLIFLDLAMPIIDGFQVLKKLKESRKTQYIPVVILTAKDAYEFKLHPATSYAEDYIVKSGEFETLKSKIKDILSKLNKPKEK